jgi:hypothetical protein
MESAGFTQQNRQSTHNAALPAVPDHRKSRFDPCSVAEVLPVFSEWKGQRALKRLPDFFKEM